MNEFWTSIFVAFCFFSCSREEPAPTFFPHILDDRLALDLIATEPEVATPIGLAIDANDDLYVLESNTHSPPKDYPGPKFDRILKGIDPDGDGIPDSWLIYADSIVAGMNLDFGPDNTLYLAQKNRVTAYRDSDNDGISDWSKVLLRMDKPENVYVHAGILGVTVFEGWVYVSRGNTGSLSWTIKGTDGSSLHGYGDGGNVVRCRTDGSSLEEVATGFWNPFDIKFTLDGRLMLVDNDPDSRGPNRLVEVVPGGDYGYQSLYGVSGIHPFQSWNGELPGTLPYAAAVGEAPSGLLDAGHSNFPADYKGNILATVWEENTIVRIPLSETQSTVQGIAEVVVQGDSLFHPVALATNSLGDAYITDWVVRQYPNHGKGRIWRLRNKGGNKRTPLAGPSSKPFGKAGIFQQKTVQFQSKDDILQAFASNDPFQQSIARKAWREGFSDTEKINLLRDQESGIRLQALLTLIPSETEIPANELKRLLRDSDQEIRRMAMIYSAKHARSDILLSIEGMLKDGGISSELFETYLATLRQLQPGFIKDRAGETEEKSSGLKRELPKGYLMSLIQDTKQKPEIRALAISFLENPSKYTEGLASMLPSSPPVMQEALLHSLRISNSEAVADAMLRIAMDGGAEPKLRALAVSCMAFQADPKCDELPSLLQTGEGEVLRETVLRHLCRCADDAEISKSVVSAINDLPEAMAIWALCSGDTEKAGQPVSLEGWRDVINGNGNPQKGRMVFQSTKAQCQTCHKVEHWGGIFGPALTHIGSSKNREQLVNAVLDPSLEISPEWQGWFVTDKGGTTHYGRQIDVGGSSVELMLQSGDFEHFQDPLDYGVAPNSLMPEGLQNGLTPAEFSDLIAYLASLK